MHLRQDRFNLFIWVESEINKSLFIDGDLTWKVEKKWR